MIQRYFNSEARAKGEGDFPQEVSGRGAVVGVLTDLGYAEEEIAVGAFADADLSDVLICFNHNLDTILGRTAAGTGTVGIDADGHLVYAATSLDQANPAVAPAVRYIQRGEVNKSSFMFEINESVWSDSEKYGSYGKRTITKIGKVYETGPVTLPAYNETSSYAREKDMIIEQRSQWIQANETPTDHLAEDEEYRDAEWRNLYNLILK